MANVILKCDGTDPVHKPDWDPIVGQRTLADGGRVGDLLKITRAHLEDAKEKGELREEDAGAAYSAAIMESMKSAIAFELAYTKSQLDTCFIQAQIDQLKCECDNATLKTTSEIELNTKRGDKIDADIINDDCRAKAECALKTAQKEQVVFETTDILPENKLKIIKETALSSAQGDKVTLETTDLIPAQVLQVEEETKLVTEKIETEDKNNMTDGVLDNEIFKIQEEVKISRTRTATEKANSIANIDKNLGYDYTLDSDGNIVIGTDTKDGKLDADKDLVFANIDSVEAQTSEIPLESARRDCTTKAECALKNHQVDKIDADIINDKDKTASMVSLNAAQENKLACDCCNTSAQTSADIDYRMQQIAKSICDCQNSTIVSKAQADLYTRQAIGFDDNANQKLYDTQMNAWSMVFGDTNLTAVTPSINDNNVNSTYKRLCNRLADGAGSSCDLYDANGNIQPIPSGPPPTT